MRYRLNGCNISLLCLLIASCATPAGKSVADNSASAPAADSIVVTGKPVIYLYPPKTEQVSVTLAYTGRLTVTYPDYNQGWQVNAYPDGKLINKANGREYSYLFWEGLDSDATYDMSNGFLVKGADTEAFLQKTLAKLGLMPKEYNEFIVYWLPKMINHSYNIIHFASQTEYGDRAKLTILPVPDAILRVFMVFKPVEEAVDVHSQPLPGFKRTGFSVVEWGGSELK